MKAGMYTVAELPQEMQKHIKNVSSLNIFQSLEKFAEKTNVKVYYGQIADIRMVTDKHDDEAMVELNIPDLPLLRVQKVHYKQDTASVGDWVYILDTGKKVIGHSDSVALLLFTEHEFYHGKEELIPAHEETPLDQLLRQIKAEGKSRVLSADSAEYQQIAEKLAPGQKDVTIFQCVLTGKTLCRVGDLDNDCETIMLPLMPDGSNLIGMMYLEEDARATLEIDTTAGRIYVPVACAAMLNQVKIGDSIGIAAKAAGGDKSKPAEILGICKAEDI